MGKLTMIDLLLALHGLAQQRGEGLLPELAAGLRKMPRLGEGRLIAIDGGAGENWGEKDAAALSHLTPSETADKAREAG
jgi:hypothetical protein